MIISLDSPPRRMRTAPPPPPVPAATAMTITSVVISSAVHYSTAARCWQLVLHLANGAAAAGQVVVRVPFRRVLGASQLADDARRRLPPGEVVTVSSSAWCVHAGGQLELDEAAICSTLPTLPGAAA